MAIKINGSDVIDDNGAFVLGISSAGVSQTPGPVRTLNFVGSGNTFLYDAATDTIDISISGGGGPGAPVINNVTLSEDVNDTVRFTSKGFTADVDMLSDNPVSQKSIKGTITGNFKVYEESGAISNVNTQVFTTEPWDFEPNPLDLTYFNQTSVSSGWWGYAIMSTTRGAGNGVGYYVATGIDYQFVDQFSQYVHRTGIKISFTPDLTTNRTTLEERLTEIVDTVDTDDDAGSVPIRIVRENDIVWIENQRINQAAGTDSGLDYHQDRQCWLDSTFTMFGNSSRRLGSCWTSDGKVPYRAGVSAGNYIIQYYYELNPGQWVPSSNITVGSHNINETSGIVYHKPTNELIVVTNGTCYTLSIDDTVVDGSTTRFAVTSTVTQFTADERVAQMVYCGDDGSYMVVKEALSSNAHQFMRYDATQNKFILLTNPGTSAGVGAFNNRFFAGGNFDGKLYVTHRPNITSTTADLVESTDNGSTWSSKATSSSLSGVNAQTGAIGGISRPGWSPKGLISGLVGESGAEPVYYMSQGQFSSTVTVPSGTDFMNNITVGQTVGKKDDEENQNFVGEVGSVGSNTVQIRSAVPYSIGDSVINLSTFTQTSTTRYLNLDTAGNVSSLQSTDPGFVQIGPGTSISIDFPGNFTNGITPDNEIPGSGQLRIEVSATNSQATDTFLSNGVTPT